MSLVATLLLNRQITLPHGTPRVIDLFDKPDPEADHLDIDSTQSIKYGTYQRRRVLALLDIGPATISDVENELGISRTRARRHLLALKESGIVTCQPLLTERRTPIMLFQRVAGATQ